MLIELYRKREATIIPDHQQTITNYLGLGHFTHAEGGRGWTNSCSRSVASEQPPLSMLTSEITPQRSLDYQVDNADRRQTMTFGHNQLLYTFDNANRLTRISQSGTG
jgi:hypothetical protein